MSDAPGNLERELQQLLERPSDDATADAEADHGHLIDLDRAFVKVVGLNARTEKRVERLEHMVEALLVEAGLPVPPRVR